MGNICGFLTVIGGIFLLNAFRDMDISWRDVSSAAKKAVTATGSTDSIEDHAETYQLLDSNAHDDVLNEIDRSNNSYNGSNNSLSRGAA